MIVTHKKALLSTFLCDEMKSLVFVVFVDMAAGGAP